MRHELAIFVVLLSCAPCLHAQEDPAYVDSPANKARPDPARADAVGKGTGRSAEYAATNPRSSEEEAAAAEAVQQETLAHIERMTAAYAEAAQRGQQQGMAAATREQQYATYTDPPIGGRDLLDDVRRDPDLGYGSETERIMVAPRATAPLTEASARQQVGSALLQDAAGAVDARTRRELYGNSGPVYLPGDAHRH